jgi:protein-disulfide isomerase
MTVEEFAMTTVASTLLIPPVTRRDHIRGPALAAVTLVEYGDYTCAHCNEARIVVRQLRSTFGDRLRYVFRHLPISISHPNARRAAEAAEASGAQNKFWEMHELLYDRQPTFSDKHLKVYATQVGLDMERFNRDMALRTFDFRVQQDVLSAGQSGVSATPAFFINDSRHLGLYDFEALLSHMEEFG